MLDESDYKEPRCVLCEDNFYNPNSDAPDGRIEVARILTKADSLYDQVKYSEIETLLKYWEKEAESLKDISGQLTMLSEMIGLFRKMHEKDKSLWAINKALKILDSSAYSDSPSAGTIYLNAATTLKAFGEKDRSIDAFKKAEALYDKYLKKDDELYGGLYNNMALLYVDLKQYDKAEELYLKALDLMQKAKKPLEIAITYVNIAQLYFSSLDMDTCIEKIMDCMNKAYASLMDKNNTQNGYYAFVASSCIPAFEQFGFGEYKDELQRRVDTIYGRN